jgi:predicted transcriptional regulator
MPSRRRISFFLDRELEDGLQELKEKVGIPNAEAIRRAINDYLERQGVQVKEVKSERKRAATRRRS